MNSWRQQAIKHQSVISWLLVMAILSMIVLPSHFHFHHETSESSVHDHSIDLHLMISESVLSHDEDDAVVFATATQDKNNSQAFSPLALIALFCVLFSLVISSTRFTISKKVFSLKHYFYFLSPQLRAHPTLNQNPMR